MSSSFTSEILICINYCDKDLASLDKLRASSWYKDCESNPNVTIIEYKADPSLGDNDFSFCGKNLVVNTSESYDNLCIKTLKMLNACHTALSFDFLIKIDCTIIEGRHNHISDLFSFENFVKTFYSNTLFQEYEGCVPITHSSVGSFRAWASSKKLFVLPEILLSKYDLEILPQHYWAGSCYCLQQNIIAKILEQDNLFKDFQELMGGCEDLCIGLAYELTKD
jgi:hypothetical protein